MGQVVQSLACLTSELARRRGGIVISCDSDLSDRDYVRRIYPGQSGYQNIIMEVCQRRARHLVCGMCSTISGRLLAVCRDSHGPIPEMSEARDHPDFEPSPRNAHHEPKYFVVLFVFPSDGVRRCSRASADRERGSQG